MKLQQTTKGGDKKRIEEKREQTQQITKYSLR